MAIISKNQDETKRKNNLLTVLEDEGIRQSELSARSGASVSTINKVANQKLAITKTMQNKLVKYINIISMKTFTREQVFPEYPEMD